MKKLIIFLILFIGSIQKILGANQENQSSSSSSSMSISSISSSSNRSLLEISQQIIGKQYPSVYQKNVTAKFATIKELQNFPKDLLAIIISYLPTPVQATIILHEILQDNKLTPKSRLEYVKDAIFYGADVNFNFHSKSAWAGPLHLALSLNSENELIYDIVGELIKAGANTNVDSISMPQKNKLDSLYPQLNEKNDSSVCNQK